MNISYHLLSNLGQKITFQLVHKTSIWILLLLLMTASAAWHLANLLTKHNAREREANFARHTAVFYGLLALILWLCSIFMA